MSSSARERIFAKVRNAVAQGDFNIPDLPPLTWPEMDKDEKLASFKEKMEAMRTEVHVTTAADWPETLKAALKERNLSRMLYAPETPVGKALQSAWGGEGLPELVTYEGTVEDYKETLFFNTDAVVTTAKAGIADTGVVVIWPDENEPRLNSLVPPVHIAVLDAKDIYGTFSEAIEAGKWSEGMPSNVLLISGPSKTADIELVLVFGVHGPSEVIVLVLDG